MQREEEGAVLIDQRSGRGIRCQGAKMAPVSRKVGDRKTNMMHTPLPVVMVQTKARAWEISVACLEDHSVEEKVNQEGVAGRGGLSSIYTALPRRFLSWADRRLRSRRCTSAWTHVERHFSSRGRAQKPREVGVEAGTAAGHHPSHSGRMTPTEGGSEDACFLAAAGATRCTAAGPGKLMSVVLLGGGSREWKRADVVKRKYNVLRVTSGWPALVMGARLPVMAGLD